MNKITAALLILLAAACMLATACQSGSSSWTGENWKPVIGVQTADFELAGLDGQAVRLSYLQGRPVMVNF